MKIFNIGLFSITCMLIAPNSFAQTDSLDLANLFANEYKSHFKASLNFLTNNVYYGRAYDTVISYITPQIGYYHKSGLFLDASASYAASGPVKHFDLFTIDAGYEFASSDEKLSGSFTASKFFYTHGSGSVKSAVKSSLYSSLDYDFKAVFIDVSAGANFADKTDFAVSAGLGHNFYSKDDKWLVSPGAFMYAGSQHFYTAFRNKNRRPGSGQPFITLQDNSSFKILDYEFSIPVSYQLGKYGFSFTPSYAMPVNPVIYPNFPIFSEKLKNRFYAEVEVLVKF